MTAPAVRAEDVVRGARKLGGQHHATVRRRPPAGTSAVLSAAVAGGSGTRSAGDAPVTAAEYQDQDRRDDVAARAVANDAVPLTTTLCSVHLSASARAGELEPLHLLDLDRPLVDRELARAAGTRRSGPTALHVLRGAGGPGRRIA